MKDNQFPYVIIRKQNMSEFLEVCNKFSMFTYIVCVQSSVSLKLHSILFTF